MKPGKQLAWFHGSSLVWSKVYAGLVVAGRGRRGWMVKALESGRILSAAPGFVH